MNRPVKTLLFLLIYTLVGIGIPCHESWIMPEGNSGVLIIGHGHSFPESEQAMNPSRLHIFLTGEDGNRQSVSAKRETGRLTVAPPSRLEKLHNAFFYEDPLIYNRTSRGIKTGPMSQYQGVVDSFRRHRSGLFQVDIGNHFQAEVEQFLIYLIMEKQDLVLVSTLGGTPAGDVDIALWPPQAKESRKLGRTDKRGRLTVIGTRPGLHLFSAQFTQDCKDPQTLRDDYSATLVVHIK